VVIETESGGPGPSPEIALLLRCVAADANGPSPEEFTRCAAAVADWAKVFDIAAKHTITSLVCRALCRFPPGVVPRDILDQFRVAAAEIAVRALRLTSDLVAIVHELEIGDVEALPVKGPTLAALVYGDLSLRAYEDLDLLVHPWDLDRATSALTALGYRFRDALSEHQRETLTTTGYHVGFEHPDSGTVVELHWLLNHKTLAHRDLERRWWLHTQSICLGGATMHTLAPEHLLLYLCMHGGKHSWARLSWLCDLRQTLKCFPNADWSSIWRAAEENGASRMVSTGLALVKELLDGAALASTPFSGRLPDPAATRLAATIGDRLLRSPDEVIGVDFVSQLRFRERFRDRARYAAHILTAPHPADVSLLALPPLMRGAYYIFRPARLVWKHILHRAHHVGAR